MADCYDFIYNGGRVVLEASRDNTGWDDTCLLAFYNYCRVWDSYAEIGWRGGDGLGTPILILKDYCNRDHEPIDNAAYAGQYYGWQIFLSSSANAYSQCLDVLAHEFTHCVTGSVMTYNAYMNDYGAINEAISDIQGNLCEMLFGATEDTSWEIAENSGLPIRSMSDPHSYGQPEYAWDIYYIPKVKAPTALNDRGGVHNNSSLLNSIAWRLCEKGGMSLSDARAFWFAVDCSMVPGTDYAQLSELLPWVLANLGMEGYTPSLEAAMDAARIRSDEMPDVFDQDRALVTLTLPEGERFADGNWELLIVTVDVGGIQERLDSILHRREGYENALPDLMERLGLDPALLPTQEEIEADPEHAWDRLAAAVSQEVDQLMAETEADGAAENEAESGPAEGEAADPGLLASLMDWYKLYFEGTIYAGTGAAGQDGRTIRMVTRPGKTLPILFRLEFDSDDHVVSAALAACTFGSWFDLGPIAVNFLQNYDAAALDAAEETPEGGGDEELSWLSGLLGEGGSGSGEEDSSLSWLSALLGDGGEDAAAAPQETEDAPAAFWADAVDFLSGMDWLWDFVFLNVKPGAICEIPSAGLDTVTILNTESYPLLQSLFTEMPQQTNSPSNPSLGAPETP